MKEELLAFTQAELDRGGALDVVVFSLEAGAALADYMVVASGTSTRHVASIATRLAETLKKQKQITASIEGLRDANWVLVDAGDIIVHIFRPEVREYYNIEELWKKTPDADTISPDDSELTYLTTQDASNTNKTKKN